MHLYDGRPYSDSYAQRLTLNERWPEVGLEDIAIDVLQERFWIVSDLPTVRPESSHPRATCCTDYNYAHGWLLLLAQSSAHMKSSLR
jgi:hypothetical protein